MNKRLFPLLLIVVFLLAGCNSQKTKVTWQTASEVDTAGFNLYRGPTADGPWQKINESLIPPSQDPIRGGDYEFTDTTAEPGKTYYYQLEEVELSGATTRFDPIELNAGAKAPAWYWWVIGALAAIVLGWLGGSFFQKRSHEAGQ